MNNGSSAMAKYDSFKAALKATNPELEETFYLCFTVTYDGRILLKPGANPPEEEYKAIVKALKEFEAKKPG